MFIGQPGRLVEIKCPVAQRVDYSERYSFAITLEGRRKAQVLPQQRRVWDVNTGNLTNPSQVADLVAFADGSWGPGPFWFIPADGPVTNLLPPRVASCAPEHALYAWTSPGGPMRTADGWVPRSYVNSTPSELVAFGAPRFGVPVEPGQMVTGSAFVAGVNAAVRLYFYDAAGQSITSATSSIRSDGSGVVRSWITREAPANAVTARVLAWNAIQAGGPAITWTNELYDFADGQGCTAAVVSAVQRDVVRAGARANDRWSNLSFTITEVG